MIFQQLSGEDYNAEAGSEKSSGTVPDSLLTKFLLEVHLPPFFLLRFFKELFKLPYEFNELLKQSFLISYKSFLLVAITGFIIRLVLTIQKEPALSKFGAESWLLGL